VTPPEAVRQSRPYPNGPAGVEGLVEMLLHPVDGGSGGRCWVLPGNAEAREDSCFLPKPSPTVPVSSSDGSLGPDPLTVVSTGCANSCTPRSPCRAARLPDVGDRRGAPSDSRGSGRARRIQRRRCVPSQTARPAPTLCGQAQADGHSRDSTGVYGQSHPKPSLQRARRSESFFGLRFSTSLKLPAV